MKKVRGYRLCYYSCGGMELPTLGGAVTEYRKVYGPLAITARTQVQLIDNTQQRQFVQTAMEADAIIIGLHGGKESCPVFNILMETYFKAEPDRRPYLHIQPTGSDEDSMEAARQSTCFGTPAWDTTSHYLTRGGHSNFRNLFVHLHNLLFKSGLHCQPPVDLPDEGIYHPDIEGVMDIKDYLQNRTDPERLTVGLWFYQTYWLNNNLEFIDSIIRSIEAQGANVIPVFHLRYKDTDRGNRGADYIVRHFFMDEDQKSRIQVLINPLLFSLTLAAPEYRDLLKKLGVPCIQAMMSLNSREAWQNSNQGMSPADVSFSAAQPEFDGNIISVAIATREQEDICPVTGGLISKAMPIPERVDKTVRLSLNWARLSQIPNNKRRVAIIFHHYPPRNDRIGCAAGLDSFDSVRLLLEHLAHKGYRIERLFSSGDQLAKELLSRITADTKWLPPDTMAERAEAYAGQECYMPWNRELPDTVRRKMEQDWGSPPGELFVYNSRMYFAGFRNGNIFITIQPPRGYLENIDKIYHDPYLSTPHHYLAQYRWIRDVFKADAVIHVGKHGSLEWLPGKALGLSNTCYPDLAIMELPNIYPYIINDPSEGTQAKRRSFACIVDHLTPVFTNADLYEELSRLDNLLTDYYLSTTEDPGKTELLQPMIWQAVEESEIHHDLEVDRAEAMADFNTFLERLHEYLHEISDTMINHGLHTLGEAPDGQRLIEFLVQLTRLANGNVPSLREALARQMGYNLDDLMENRGKRLERFHGLTGGQIVSNIHKKALYLVKRLASTQYDPATADSITKDPDIRKILLYIAEALVPAIKQCSQEIESVLGAMNGRFVEPGPSGAPTRGQAEILPTGRNFYSVDPNKIPSPGAWEVGKRLGDALIERYLQETGNYPDTIGIIVYGGATMRTRGDDIAEIYYLMGLKPIWQKGSGNVCGLEVIPLSKLGRPRLDVVPRVSGLFRDAFPNLMEQLDEAVAIVSTLNESPESNILRRNVLSDLEEYKRQGMSEDEAMREATFRVFSCPPGTYGAGVSELIESKNWKTQTDLGKNYIRYSAHAYGKGSYGRKKTANFRRILNRMDLTVKNEDSREYDMMSCTDYYNYYGGLIVAAKTVRGALPFSIMGDSSDPARVKMRTTAQEAKHILRSRLLNPKWISGMKRHGYKGAGDISHVLDIVLGWDATAEVMDHWMYDAIARKYALDRQMQEWLQEVNPHALQNILDKLLEAIARGMWNAESEMENELRQKYLEIEGEIEEQME